MRSDWAELRWKGTRMNDSWKSWKEYLMTLPKFPLWNLKTQQSPIIWICVWGKLSQRNTWLSVVTSSFSKCFPSTLKRKVGFFKFFREERLRKKKRRNKAAFSNFSDLLVPSIVFHSVRRRRPKGRERGKTSSWSVRRSDAGGSR